MYRRILAPIDGSPTSNAGMREALKLAREHKAKVRLVHVIDEFYILSAPEGGYDFAAMIDSLKADGSRLLHKAARVAGKQGVKPETALVENLAGRVADIIVQQAKRWRADLIVMGTHGRRGFNRALLGSDAELVVRNAGVPVLLVRSAGRRQSRKRQK